MFQHASSKKNASKWLLLNGLWSVIAFHERQSSRRPSWQMWLHVIARQKNFVRRRKWQITFGLFLFCKRNIGKCNCCLKHSPLYFMQWNKWIDKVTHASTQNDGAAFRRNTRAICQCIFQQGELFWAFPQWSQRISFVCSGIFVKCPDWKKNAQSIYQVCLFTMWNLNIQKINHLNVQRKQKKMIAQSCMSLWMELALIPRS